MAEIVSALKEIGSKHGNKIKINSQLKQGSIIYASERGSPNQKAINTVARMEFNIFGEKGIAFDDLLTGRIIFKGDDDVFYVDSEKFVNTEITSNEERKMFAAIYCRRHDDGFFLCNVSESIQAFSNVVTLASLNKLV